MSTDEPQIARPRTHHTREIYDGAELHRTPARPGAADAQQIPSLVLGRRIASGSVLDRVAPAPTVWTAPPPAPPIAAKVQAQTAKRAGTPRGDRHLRTLRPLIAPTRDAAPKYTPRPGSVPHGVLEHLHQLGGHLTYREIRDRWGLDQTTATATFRKPLALGILVRVLVDGRLAFALPGYEPPPSISPSDAVRAAKAIARLEQIRGWMKKAEADVDALLGVRNIANHTAATSAAHTERPTK